MVENGVLEKTFLALSRDPDIPKVNYRVWICTYVNLPWFLTGNSFQTYVQDIIRTEKKAVYRKLVEEQGHFYVCGDCTMADNVYQTLKQIIQELGRKTEQEVENYMLSMRVCVKNVRGRRWRLLIKFFFLLGRKPLSRGHFRNNAENRRSP